MKDKIAVVIPCYKVKKHILEVIAEIGGEVSRIYVVDDLCPESTGRYVAENVNDERAKVIFNDRNLGVGGAVKHGYQEALKDGMDIIVKIDGDGQMDTSQISRMISPILNGSADYTKGNRFYNIEDVKSMPIGRLIGNAGLSFLTKLSTGYWQLFDPTNGYTAIHRTALEQLPLKKIANRYFFESDMLFRLNTIRAVVRDIPVKARYADEISSLNVISSIPEFFAKNIKNFCKRVFYNYFLRNFSISSIELVLGTILISFAFIYGGYNWYVSVSTDTPAATGVVVLPAMSMILGVQFLLAFLNYDIENTPEHPLQNR